MNFYLEDINEELSEQAQDFIKKNPELKDKVTEFEKEWNFSGDLINSKEAKSFLSQDIYLDYIYQEDDWYGEAEMDDFSEPIIEDVNYYYFDNKFGIEGYLHWDAEDIDISREIYDLGYNEPPYYDESKFDVRAYAYVDIEIPDNVASNKYKTNRMNDVEYEIQ